MDHNVRVELSFKTALMTLGCIAAAWLFLELWPILLVIVVALMLVGMLNPPIQWLERRMRRPFAITLVFVLSVVAAGLFAGFMVPQFAAQLGDMMDQMPRIQAQLAGALERFRLTAPLVQSVRSIQSAELAGRLGRFMLANSSQIVEVGAYAAAALSLALYLIVDRDRMRGGMFAVVPRRYHLRLSRVLVNLGEIVGGYLRGQLVLSGLVTAFTLVVLSIAGVSHAIAWAVFAGLLDILPYLGVLLACGPLFLAALSRGTLPALIVLGALVLYQEIESRVLVPRVYGHVLRLPASIVMLSLLVGGRLFGILGALLSLPIAAALLMLVRELRVDLPGEPDRDQAERAHDEQGERDFARRSAGVPAQEAAAIAVDITQTRIQQETPAAPVAMAPTPERE